MNSNSLSGEVGHNEDSLDLPVDQFKVIFQMTKELSNLSDADIAQAGFTRVETDSVHNAANAIRRNLEEVSLVRIYVNRSESLCTISLIGSTENPLGPVMQFDLLMKWHDMIMLVLSRLGSRESYLRTGYEEREIRAAVGKLEALHR